MKKTLLSVLILAMFAAGCAGGLPFTDKRHIKPGTEITIRFVEDREAVSAIWRAKNLGRLDAPLYVPAFVEGTTIVLAPCDFNPFVLAHELCHLTGDHYADGLHGTPAIPINMGGLGGRP